MDIYLDDFISIPEVSYIVINMISKYFKKGMLSYVKKNTQNVSGTAPAVRQ